MQKRSPPPVSQKRGSRLACVESSRSLAVVVEAPEEKCRPLLIQKMGIVREAFGFQTAIVLTSSAAKCDVVIEIN
ncbi:Protein of unknown function [Gryllus bimaculatus]|nr:Protein of unknown function [Gryllus bimaculatus]